MPGALVTEGLGIIANLGTARWIQIRAEFNIAVPPGKPIGFVFVIRVFDIKVFTATNRAFHWFFS
jgi:hypothetical protein